MAPFACAYGHHDRKCPIFHVISLGYKVHLSVSARGPHEMISGRSLPTPGIAYAKQLRYQKFFFVLIGTKKIYQQNKVMTQRRLC